MASISHGVMYSVFVRRHAYFTDALFYLSFGRCILAFFRGETAYCDVGFTVSLAMCHAMGYRLWIAKFRFFPIVLLLLDIIWAILIVI